MNEDSFEIGTVASNVLSVRDFQIWGEILLQRLLHLFPRNSVVLPTFGIKLMTIASFFHVAMTILSRGDVS